MWPIHGVYACRDCGRHFAAFAEAPVAHQAGRLSAARPLAFERNGAA
jgi:hypothetical protein